jgi:hypothetical protein
VRKFRTIEMVIFFSKNLEPVCHTSKIIRNYKLKCAKVLEQTNIKLRITFDSTIFMIYL